MKHSQNKDLLLTMKSRFLWVRLQLQLLCHMQTEYQVLSALESLPPTLSATYDQIYEGIKRSPSTHEAQKALAWLACARKPLRPDQWAVAVSWTIRKKTRPENVKVIYLSAETLLGMCQNLVVHDEMQNCITFAHVSVREYLESKRVFATSELEFMAVVEQNRKTPVRTVETASVPFLPIRGRSTRYPPSRQPGMPSTAMMRLFLYVM